MTTTRQTEPGAQRAAMVLRNYSTDDGALGDLLGDLADLAVERGLDWRTIVTIAGQRAGVDYSDVGKLDRGDAIRFDRELGAMPYGAIAHFDTLAVGKPETHRATFDDVIGNLARLRTTLGRVAADNEKDRNDLDGLRAQRRAIRDFLGLGEK